MRVSIGTTIAAVALASCVLPGCSESQRDPNDHSAMAAGVPAVRAVSDAATAPAEGIAGRTWVVEVREEGNSETRVDTLTFADGTVATAGFAREGFGAAEYRNTRDNVGETFTAVSTSSANEQLELNGILVKGRLDGSATVKQKGGAAKQYRFHGYAVDK